VHPSDAPGCLVPHTLHTCAGVSLVPGALIVMWGVCQTGTTSGVAADRQSKGCHTRVFRQVRHGLSTS
jgi:hypothetical protein